MKTTCVFVSPGHEMFDSSVRAFIPRSVTIPFRQSDDSEYFCGFQAGDIVREGQVIASPETGSNGANIHSAVPGKIVSVSQCTLPDGKLGKVAVISTEGSFSYLGKKLEPSNWSFLSASSLLDEFNSKGIVNTFSKKTEPLAEQIKRNRKEKKRFVIVRMFDDDPSRYTDSFLAEKFFDEVIQGAIITAKATDAKGLVFVMPSKKSFSINNDILKERQFFVVNADSSKYPSGLMPALIKTIRRLAKGSENQEFTEVDENCIFLDPETALSVFDAVVYGIPVVERYVHVFGPCLKFAGMFKARIGSSIKSLVEQCGGFITSPSKIIINGMITGNSVGTLDVPVTKSVKSIEFISELSICFQNENPCVRCGKCRKVCPEALVPDLLYKHSIDKYPLPKEILDKASLCFQCHLCTSVCPSRLPLSHAIALIGKSKKE